MPVYVAAQRYDAGLLAEARAPPGIEQLASRGLVPDPHPRRRLSASPAPARHRHPAAQSRRLARYTLARGQFARAAAGGHAGAASSPFPPATRISKPSSALGLGRANLASPPSHGSSAGHTVQSSPSAASPAPSSSSPVSKLRASHRGPQGLSPTITATPPPTVERLIATAQRRRCAATLHHDRKGRRCALAASLRHSQPICPLKTARLAHRDRKRDRRRSTGSLARLTRQSRRIAPVRKSEFANPVQVSPARGPSRRHGRHSARPAGGHRAAHAHPGMDHRLGRRAALAGSAGGTTSARARLPATIAATARRRSHPHSQPPKDWRKSPFCPARRSMKSQRCVATSATALRCGPRPPGSYPLGGDSPDGGRPPPHRRGQAPRAAARWLFTERVATHGCPRHRAGYRTGLAPSPADDAHPGPALAALRPAPPKPGPTSILARLRRSPSVLINPGAGWGAKRWPVERYAAVAQGSYSTAACRVLVNAGPGEEPSPRPSSSKTGGAAHFFCLILEQLIALTRRICPRHRRRHRPAPSGLRARPARSSASTDPLTPAATALRHALQSAAQPARAAATTPATTTPKPACSPSSREDVLQAAEELLYRRRRQ